LALTFGGNPIICKGIQNLSNARLEKGAISPIARRNDAQAKVYATESLGNIWQRRLVSTHICPVLEPNAAIRGHSSGGLPMIDRIQKYVKTFSITTAAVLFMTPFAANAQTTSGSNDKWLHVRVISSDNKGETVRVNVPLELAEKVLPAINKDRLHNGKITVDRHEMEGVDCRALLDAIKTTKDGEFVTVQSHDSDVQVAKQGGYMLVHVTEKRWNDDKSSKEAKMTEKSKIEVKVPMKVVEALFSAGKDELDVLAALRALSAHGDTELVSVKDGNDMVRVWMDSKSASD
jgi:hypothetical protein